MKKIIAFIYGVLAYLVFLIAFLYAIGFVGNLIVPKSIDSGTETTLIQALLINSLLLGLFAIQHSVMARPAFKKWITGIISPAIERSTYVLLSSSLLILLYWKWQPLTTVVWQAENETVVMILKGVFFGQMYFYGNESSKTSSHSGKRNSPEKLAIAVVYS